MFHFFVGADGRPPLQKNKFNNDELLVNLRAFVAKNRK